MRKDFNAHALQRETIFTKELWLAQGTSTDLGIDEQFLVLHAAPRRDADAKDLGFQTVRDHVLLHRLAYVLHDAGVVPSRYDPRT